MTLYKLNNVNRNRSTYKILFNNDMINLDLTNFLVLRKVTSQVHVDNLISKPS